MSNLRRLREMNVPKMKNARVVAATRALQER
jgi:hypothetical protein